MTEQYVEIPDGLDLRNFWTKEGNQGMDAAAEAMIRFDNSPAMAVKDIIDNPDLNQYQSEVAVARISGIVTGIQMSKPRDIFTEFLESLDG